MRGGPLRHVVDEGALALQHGWDPFDYLSKEGFERAIAREILQAAVDRKSDRDDKFWKNAIGAVANGIGRAFGRG